MTAISGGQQRTIDPPDKRGVDVDRHLWTRVAEPLAQWESGRMCIVFGPGTGKRGFNEFQLEFVVYTDDSVNMKSNLVFNPHYHAANQQQMH